MNILHTECGLNWGGQEFRTLLEWQWLNSNGYQSWLMCNQGSELYKRAVQLQADKVVAINFTQTWRVDIWLRVLFFCWRKKIDVINAHGSRDALVCALANFLAAPVVRSRQVTNPIKKIFSYKYLSTHILAAADVIKSTLVAEGVDAKKITVVGEGVDMYEYASRPRPAALLKEFNIGIDEQVVINIGMIRPDKGQQYFIQAAKTVIENNNKVRFFIIGDATRKKSHLAYLKKLISDLNIEKQCELLGYREDVAEFINLASLVVVASTGTEAQSRIVPQAFASKTTVVSTSTGGLTELVKNEINGLVVEPANAEAMSAAIFRLLDDEPLKQQLEQQAYKFAVEEMSFEKMMAKTISLYRNMIKA